MVFPDFIRLFLIMKTLLFTLIIFLVVVAYGQENVNLKLKILDSCYVKEIKQDVIKIRVQLTSDNFEFDSLILYKFYKFIPSNQFIYDYSTLNKFSMSSTGLIYIIEDTTGRIIAANEQILPSFKNFKDEIKSSKYVDIIDDNSLRLKRVKVDDLTLHKYQLSKYSLNDSCKEFILFPLLVKYHDLKQGIYKLYLIYSFNESVSSNPPSISLWDDCKSIYSKIYIGTVISNKVDLIIK